MMRARKLPLLPLIILLTSESSAFVTQSSLVSSPSSSSRRICDSRLRQSSSSSPSTDDDDTISSSQKKKDSNVLNLEKDLSNFVESTDLIRNNVFEGKVGGRGEGYVAAQVVVGLCLLVGSVPVIGDVINFILGPGLLLGGAAIVVLSVLGMGKSLSPWPVPAESNEGLITTGLYGLVRHPIYAGLLAACAGFSTITGSVTRLVLTALLLYVLDLKCQYEEEELMKKFPGEYDDYVSAVPGRFFPQAFLDSLPWARKT